MKAINFKVSLLVFSIIGCVIILQSCSDTPATEPTTTQTKNFNLISPNGQILANRTDEIQEMILKNSEIQAYRDEIILENINYIENEMGTIAIVDFLVDRENKSMLVPMQINEGYVFLIDNESLIIKKNVTEEKQTFNSNDAIYLKSNFNRTKDFANRTAYVCNGSCCGWSDMGNNHYHCGCPSAKLVLTTGNNCQIQVIGED